MIKLIACDLDGTLIRWFESEENPIRLSDLDAIKKIEQEGIKFVVNTSRHHQFLSAFMKEETYNKSVIGGGGATILIDQKLIRKIQFSKEEITKLIQYFKDKVDLQLLAVSDQREFISSNHQANRFLILKDDPIDHEFGNVSPTLLQDYIVDELPEINYFFINPNQLHDSKYIEQLKIDLPEFDYIDCGPGAIQIVKDGVNKKEALEFLMKRFHYTREEIAVIGDGMNDIVMFEEFPHSFAMSQANDFVKQHATYQVDSVKEAIELIQEINKGAFK